MSILHLIDVNFEGYYFAWSRFYILVLKINILVHIYVHLSCNNAMLPI